MTTGGCNCGAIRYEIKGPLRPVIACHCEQCRKTSGFHVAATSAAKSDIVITGDPTWFHASDTARRGFCPTCGSNLFWDGPGANLSIFAGTINSPTGLTLKGHIYCADKGDYYDLSDDLPKAPGDHPDLTTKVSG
ncbi:MAG: GFA family protein [Boseongicola sp.]|nr:MAG: GFA family protein [Boseongicola sp.]